MLEGVFSASPELADLVDRSVFVDTPEPERLRRLHARVTPEEWDTDWLAAEQAYFDMVAGYARWLADNDVLASADAWRGATTNEFVPDAAK